MQNYDLIVIGSGPGGQRAAIQAAKCGKRVALVEKQSSIGGTCINFGTIPSKTLREAVLHLSGFHYQNLYGVDYRVKKDITMEDLIFRVKRVIETEISVTQAQLQRNGIEMLHGTASFATPNHIRVREQPRRTGGERRNYYHRHGHQARDLAESTVQQSQHFQ